MEDHLNNRIQWPGWEVVRVLGRGSFGAVYEIRRTLPGGKVELAALKVISIPQNSGDIEELLNDGYDSESITERFDTYLEEIVREYSFMVEMKGHTNVVYCDDFRYVQHDDGFGYDIYIKMELLTPMSKVIGRECDEAQTIKLGIDICNALVYCKSRNVVHRDIKPQNIFVSPEGHFKLGDFGIAKTAEHTTSGTKIGTYKYMAPEVYHDEPYGSAADIYSLGLVLYWMLNNRRMPFQPLDRAATAAEEESSRKRRFRGEEIPAPVNGSDELKRIVLKACAFDPQNRYASAAEMKADLEKLAGIAAPIPVPVPEPEPEPEPVPEPVPEPGGDGPTVGPAPVPPTPAPHTPPKPSPSGRRISPWVFAAIGLLIVLLLVILLAVKGCSGGKTQPPQGSTSSGDGQVIGSADEAGDTSEVPNEEPEQEKIERIDVADVVGLTAEEAQSVLEAQGFKTVFLEKESGNDEKGRVLEQRPVAGSANRIGDTVILSVGAGAKEPGPWSEWMTELPTGISEKNYDIEEQTEYSCRTLETTTSSSSTLSGWTLYDSTSSWGDYGSWSDWSTTAVSPSDSTKVETKTQYSYRDQTSSTSTTYGSWSEWQDTPISESSTLQVETRQVEATPATTSYQYSGYFSDDSPGKPNSTWSHFCPICAANAYGGTWVLRSVTTTSRMTPKSLGQSCGHKGSFPNAWVVNGLQYYYEEQITTPATYKTQYRSRTVTKTTEYSWGSWSAYSDTAYTASSTRQVRTRTMYRYCTRSLNYTYYYQRWGAWSEYSASPVSASSNVEVRTRTVYRYREK